MGNAGHMGRLIAGTGLGLGAALAAAPHAHADVDSIVVTSKADPGDGNCATNGCTLREAMNVANDGDTTDLDTITFQSGLSGQILLTAGELPLIDEPLAISGPGAGTLAVDGNGVSRIFDMNVSGGRAVTVSGLTLRDGDPPAGAGGAILNQNGNLTVQSDVLTGNSTSASGTLTTGGGGGAIAGAVTILDSTLSGNWTSGSDAGGGAVYGPATVRRSAISGNRTTGPDSDGGAIYNRGGITVVDSTISGNYALASDGGGVAWYYANTYFGSSTIAGNAAAGRGGGLFAYGLSGFTSTVKDSLIADNSAGDSGDDLGSYIGPDFQLSFSLIEDPGGAPISDAGGTSIIGVDPQLGPLAANGGPTSTQKPAPTSPVIDKGHALPGETSDQRGVQRVFDVPTVANAPGGDGTDMGAVELQSSDFPSPPAPAPVPPSTPSFDLKAAVQKCKKKFPKGPKRAKCIKKAKRKANG